MRSAGSSTVQRNMPINKTQLNCVPALLFHARQLLQNWETDCRSKFEQDAQERMREDVLFCDQITM